MDCADLKPSMASLISLLLVQPWTTAQAYIKTGVPEFRYFLIMKTCCCLLMHVCIFMEMGSNTSPFIGECIGSHLNANAFMHEQTKNVILVVALLLGIKYLIES